MDCSKPSKPDSVDRILLARLLQLDASQRLERQKKLLELLKTVTSPMKGGAAAQSKGKESRE